MFSQLKQSRGISKVKRYFAFNAGSMKRVWHHQTKVCIINRKRKRDSYISSGVRKSIFILLGQLRGRQVQRFGELTGFPVLNVQT